MMSGKLPENLQQWLAYETHALKDSLHDFSDTVEIFNYASSSIARMIDSLRLKLIGADEGLRVLFHMFCELHKLMLIATTLLLERHIPEHNAVLRLALEHAADANKIRKDLSLARVWFKRDEDEAAFNKVFIKPRFPRGDPVTGPLFEPWNLVCKWGTHSSLQLHALSMESVSTEDRLHYFVVNDTMARGMFLYLVNLIPKLVKPFVLAFQDRLNIDGQKVLEELAEKINQHKQKYRNIISGSTEGHAEAG